MNWKVQCQKDEGCRLRCRRDGEMPAVRMTIGGSREQTIFVLDPDLSPITTQASGSSSEPLLRFLSFPPPSRPE